MNWVSSARCIRSPRGTSPWVVALVSVVVLGRELPITELAGVLAVSAGLIALVFIGGVAGPQGLPALIAAVLTGLAIASYTVVDGLGVMHAPVRLHRVDVLASRPHRSRRWPWLARGRRLPCRDRRAG